MKIMFDKETIKNHKKLIWHSILSCNVYIKNRVHKYQLPAVFLQKRGLIDKTIDLGNPEEYKMDFVEFKINNKNLDEFYLSKQKEKIYYTELLQYCRFLYYEKSGRIADYKGEQTDQAYNQFKQEFCEFMKIFGINKIELSKSKEFFKLFILHKGLRISGIKRVFDYTRKCIPEANCTRRQNDFFGIFFNVNKENSTFMTIGNKYSKPDTNRIYLEKMYSILLMNQDIQNDELETIFRLYNIIDRCSSRLVNQYNMFNPYDNYKRNKNLIARVEKTLYKLRDYNIYCSYMLYFVCINERKLIEKRGICLESKKIKYKHPKISMLLEIERISEKINENFGNDITPEFLNFIFTKRESLPLKDRNVLLEFIFDIKAKQPKTQIKKLTNNFKKICIVYMFTKSNEDIFEQKLEENQFYDFVISAYIYYNIRNINISKIKRFKKYDKNFFIEHMLKNMVEKDNYLVDDYMMIIKAVSQPYNYLYNVKKAISSEHLRYLVDEQRDMILIDKFYERFKESIHEIYLLKQDYYITISEFILKIIREQNGYSKVLES